MSDVDKLVRAIAFDRAYQLAANSCRECGLPSTRYDGYMGDPWCDRHEPKTDRAKDMYDSHCAAAVRRMLRIANVE